jgi:2',3'-cyclic-nucleotide 2'-phosphodiesterase (5'-nucleotidase family)
VLDTGDALVGGGILGDLTQGEAIVAGMNLMGYDAMALGPMELSMGPDLLRQRMQEASFPMLSANAVLRETGELFAEPYAILDLGDLRVGVIGLTRPPAEPGDSFEVLDPLETASGSVSEVAAQADVVVVLTNEPYSSALGIGEAVAGIDLLIAGRPQQLPTQARRIPATGTIALTTEPPAQRHTGRRVGRLAVTVDRDRSLIGESWQPVALDRTIPDSPSMTALLKSYP